MREKIENSVDWLTKLKLEIVDSNEWIWGNPETDKKWIDVVAEAVEVLKDCKNARGGER